LLKEEEHEEGEGVFSKEEKYSSIIISCSLTASVIIYEYLHFLP